MKINKKISIPLEKFIEDSLYSKNDGYYMSKNPFGHKGDFITSPNISIFFSEMIAVWIMSFWEKLNKPINFNIVELGAGNGEMMEVIIKTLKKFSIFDSKYKIYIFEKSPHLKKLQKKKLKNSNTIWINDLKEIRDAPSIFLANEFFDALPINQYLKKNNKWYERKVQNKENKTFKFLDVEINIKKIEKKVGYRLAENQTFIEISNVLNAYLGKISEKLNKNSGGLLIIDYGYKEKKMRNTLRGFRDHKIVNILSNYKRCDITYSLSFNQLKMIAKKFKLKVAGLTTQRNFLQSLGIMQRAEIISKNLPFSKKADIYYRIEKLIGNKEMGEIFKVMLITDNRINFQLGF